MVAEILPWTRPPVSNALIAVLDDARLPVSEALSRMQTAVKRGASRLATDIGGSSEVPLNLPSSEIQIDSHLSSGAEADVLRATWNGTPVAVKKPRIRVSSDLDRFRNEVALLSMLRGHPNVVQLLGARALPPDYFLVTALEGPSLHSMLHGSGGWRPGLEETLAIGVGVAKAMARVHELGVLHRDVKPGNVLWAGPGGRVVLVDFGIAKRGSDLEVGVEGGQKKRTLGRGKPSGGFHKAKMVGTLEYMAPEVLQSHAYSPASDVYAFAITLNEIATGVYPFSDCTKELPDVHTVLEMGYGRQELAVATATEGLRPTLPPKSSFPPEWFDIFHQCWDPEPSRRPTFRKLVDSLGEMLGRVKCQQRPMGQITNGLLKEVVKRNLDRSECGVELEMAVLGQIDFANGGSTLWKGLENGKPELLRSDNVRNVRPYREIDGLSIDADFNGYMPVVRSGAFASAGRRGEDRMEDRHSVVESFMGYSESTLLGVFDGHRGHEAAKCSADLLPEIAMAALTSEPSLEKGLISAFLDMERHFAASASATIHGRTGWKFPGCTALTALLWGNQLVVANAGDCRAVLCRAGRPIQLTVDHTANNVNERSRVIAAGAEVNWKVDGWRVGKAGMQVTRSIGDEDLKPYGVTAEPEVSRVTLGPDDEFLVMATDGLWDTLTNEDVVGLIYDTVKNPDMCAQRLVTESITRGSDDNVTAVVAFLTPVSTVEEIYNKRDPTRASVLPPQSAVSGANAGEDRPTADAGT